MSVSSKPARIRFGPYELDSSSGELSKFGHKVRLQEQPFQILALLLERPGEVVTREEIQRALWAGDTFVGFEHGLNNAIKRLRETLCDSADKPRYIETLPRRGYRFIAELEPPTPADDLPIPGHIVVPKRISSMRRRIAVLALLALVTVATVGIGDNTLHPAANVTVGIKSIAVLPLENLSGDPSQEYFAAGLTDALTTELARTVGSQMRIISRTSAEKYRNKPLAEIVRDLDVDAVVEGSVSRSGDRARINAQLVQARDDRHLWAASYERDLHDIITLEGQIAATVARRIQITLSPGAQARLAAPVIVNPQAYDLYQRARFRAFSNSPRDLAATIDLLEQAIRLDPNLATAHALLARAYLTEAFLVKPQASELETRASEEIRYALNLDPDLTEAYVAQGILEWTHRRGFPHERAIVEFRHAIALDPNMAQARHELAIVLLHAGVLDEAERQLRTAIQLEPTNMGLRYRIAVVFLDQGRLEEAVAGLEGTRPFLPELWSYQMSFALFQLGRKQEATATIRDYLRDNPRDEGGVGNAMQALLYADEGKTALAESSIRAAIDKGKDFGHFHHAAYTIGATYALMNRPVEAVHWLRTAADDGLPCYPLYERDHSLDGLRNDPAFRQFMSDLRARWEKYKSIS